MSNVERLKAELALAELEEAFVEAKAKNKVTTEMRNELRAARQEFRETWRENVVVQPSTVNASADVTKAGGK